MAIFDELFAIQQKKYEGMRSLLTKEASSLTFMYRATQRANQDYTS